MLVNRNNTIKCRFKNGSFARLTHTQRILCLIGLAARCLCNHTACNQSGNNQGVVQECGWIGIHTNSAGANE